MITRILMLVAILTACSPFRDNEVYLLKKGKPCSAIGQCESGLVCSNQGICTTIGEPGTQLARQSCQKDSACAYALVCDAQGLCGLNVPTRTGDPCSRADGCAEGLTCSYQGRCVPNDEDGTKLDGERCAASDECAYGHLCNQRGICTQFPTWNGIECRPDDAEAPPNIVFDLGGGNDIGQDFFHTPFPNDIRVHEGTVNYGGFPGLNSNGAPGTAIATYTTLLSGQANHFSPNSTITTRFSYPVDFPTLKFGGSEANFRFVDVTIGESGYGLSPRSRFFATGGRDKYVCQNYLSIRPSEGTPLREGHTYAAVFFKGLKTTDGRDFEAAEDLVPLLDARPPSDPLYAAAWEKYQPLRYWLQDEGLSADDVIGATVFTIGTPSKVVDELIDRVYAAEPLDIAQVTSCDDGPAATSCDRSVICAPEIDGDKLAVKLLVPNFLAGGYPYSGANSLLATSENSAPDALDTSERCAAVYLPNAANPEEGSNPFLVFLSDGASGIEQFVNSPLLETVLEAGFGVLVMENLVSPLVPTVDEKSEISSDAFAHDLQDPLRAKHIYFQSIMELFAFERAYFENDTIRAVLEGSDDPLVIGAHGAGVDLALPFVAFSPFSRALILGSGQGGVIDKYLEMKSPLDTGVQLQFLFADEEVNGLHPGMGLVQSWLDQRDPMNYGALVRRKTDTVDLKHIFYVYGVENTRVSPRAENALITSMRLKLVGDVKEELSAIAKLDDDESELKANVGRQATQGLKQYYAEDGAFGHNVILNGPEAMEDIFDFLEALDREDGIPVLRR